MTVKRQLWVWYLWCGLVGLFWLSMPFLWRSDAFPSYLCLFPCFAVIGFVAMVIYLCKVLFRFWHALIGFALMAGCFFLGFQTDAFARRTIFGWNYNGYRRTVSEVLRNPPKQKGDLPIETLRGYGIYRDSYEKRNGVPYILLDTCSGPTLETVAFSTKPIASNNGEYELKTKDELGYWYFLNRS